MANEPLRYDQYCPISRAVEILGERWSLLILRDLLIGYNRFNELARAAPGLSRTLLSKRLRQFERAGLVVHDDDRYELTEAGRDLLPILWAFGEWGAKWAFGEPREEELDPEVLAWWMHSRLDTGLLDGERTVLQLRFDDDPRPFWLLVERSGTSVCTVDPGFEVDVVIRSDLRTLYEIWLGRRPMKPALCDGTLRFEGSPELVGRMERVLLLSEVAPIVAAAGR